jgi:hypothetical protein
MGQRSRKRRRTAAPAGGDALRRGYARSEERNEAIRQSLEPLAPGERPGAVTVAAVVAVLLAIANTIALALGEQVGGEDARVSAVAFSVILLVAAWGMWRAKYWAVLGFQALLAVQIILAALALLVADSAWVAIVLTTIVLLGGWLFWKLVRALARLQMPERQPRTDDV